MTKTNFADEADKLLNGTASKTTKKKSKNNRLESVTKWLKSEVYDSRPIKWLAIGVTGLCVIYTTYRFTTYWVDLKELFGIVTFAVSYVILTRAFRSK
jgi:hypothetical protein